MKTKLICFAAMILLLPTLIYAETSVPVTFEGVIGDFAKKSRTYEINGKFYKFPPNIVIENQKGRRLSVDHLRGGTYVKVYGKKDIALESNLVEYYKVVVYKQ